MKFARSNARRFSRPGLKGWIYNTKKDFGSASSAYFEVNDIGHGKVKTTHSHRVYYILNGSGRFVIDDESIPVRTTDVVIVPKRTPYDYRADAGTVMKLFLVHAPAYDPSKEVKIEE